MRKKWSEKQSIFGWNIFTHKSSKTVVRAIVDIVFQKKCINFMIDNYECVDLSSNALTSSAQ